MKRLTQTQINRIFEWMNEYPELKNTGIPIRFREYFKSNVIFKNNDIVEFEDREGVTKRGYITNDIEIRCPGPLYENHPIYENTRLVLKGGWKH